MFASTDLVARIERGECTLLAEAAEAAIHRAPASGAFAIPVAGGVASFGGAASPLNKVAGLGFGGAVSEADFEACESAFGEGAHPVRIELSTVAEPSIGAAATARGYVLEGFENVMGRRVNPSESPATIDGIEIVESPDASFDEWLDVVVSGFAAPDAEGVQSDETFPREYIEGAIRDMTAAGGFTRYIATCGGEVAGAASMRVSAGLLQLTGAATLPAHRRKGVQTALLARRLADASRAGCDVAVMTTQPASKSQQNAHRQGFDLLYARAVLTREPVVA